MMFTGFFLLVKYIAGLHHAREPLTISMNLFITTKLLFDLYHDDEENL